MQADAKSWRYNVADKCIFMNLGASAPANHTVEISTLRRVFAPHIRGLGYIVVEGLVIEYCGNQYPTNFWKEPL